MRISSAPANPISDFADPEDPNIASYPRVSGAIQAVTVKSPEIAVIELKAM